MTQTRLTFILRLGSTLVLWVLMLSTVFAGYEFGFLALLGIMALRALWEYFRMLESDGIGVFTITGLTCAAALLFGGFYIIKSHGPANCYDFELLVLVLFLMTIFARQMFRGAENDPLRAMSYTVFGLLYIPWLFSFLTKIIYLTPTLENGQTTGQYYVLYLVAVTKFSDMGAYVFGSLFGKTPFAPHISPKKTWEGFFRCVVLVAPLQLLDVCVDAGEVVGIPVFGHHDTRAGSRICSRGGRFSGVDREARRAHEGLQRDAARDRRNTRPDR